MQILPTLLVLADGLCAVVIREFRVGRYQRNVRMVLVMKEQQYPFKG